MEKQHKATLGWSVVGDEAAPVEGGKMTYDQAKEQSAIRRKEKADEEEKKAKAAGDPDMKAFMARMDKRDEEARRAETAAREAELTAYRERTDKLIEHITNNKGDGKDKNTFKALVPDEITGKYVFKTIPLDEPFVPPAIKTEKDPQEDEKLKIAREELELKKQDMQAKQNILGDLAASVIKTGSTIASAYVGEKIGSGGPAMQKRLTQRCPDCSFDIPVTPDWKQATCPKCQHEFFLKVCDTCKTRMIVRKGMPEFDCPNPECRAHYGNEDKKAPAAAPPPISPPTT